MASTVRSRPNHYETLGLTPSASGDEIARAFAREISLLRPRPFGGIAEVSIAYETLRDPAKRRAYDASIGLGPQPQTQPRRAPAARWNSAQFIGSALAERAVQPVHDTLPSPATPLTPQPRPEPAAEPRMAPFIAASPRKPVNAAIQDTSSASTQGEPQHPPKPEAMPRLKPEDLQALPRAKEESPALGVDERPIEWRRMAVAVGGVVLTVAILGAVAGWSAGIIEEPQQADAAVTMAVPAAKPLASTAAASPAPVRSVAEARPKRPARAAPPRIQPAPPPQLAMSEKQLSDGTQGQAEDTVVEQEIADSPAVAADLPLPNGVIARTIERIGYACGRVASTTAIAGEGSGVYKVTCSSGRSYQARPVRGRYHFRRLGSR